MEKRVSEDEMTGCITDAMDTNVGKPQGILLGKTEGRGRKDEMARSITNS